MEPAQSAAAAGGGGPAPFLLKTYEMVDDSSTDDIVSWTPTNSSFVVWNPPEFAARLLPTFFKHNNFSSFIRQLNTYGFKKIDAERWEFANEEFIKGKKHLLKNIHRRKPIHSHSHSHSHAAVGGLSDAERAALEDEIDRLNRDKATLQADLWRFKQQQSGTAIQLDDLERRLIDMEQRQHKMMAFLQKAIQNPKFVDSLRQMAGARDEGLVATHKKRRLPGVDYCPDVGQVFNRDFCDKLTLELCPALSASNLASTSTQSSNEDMGSPQMEQHDRLECLSFVPDMLEPSDTGKDVLFPRTMNNADEIIPCHLDLTLASCLMHRGHSPDMNANSVDRAVGEGAEQRAASGGEDGIGGIVQKSQGITADPGAAGTQAVKPETQNGNQAPPPPPGRVNDMFWEQFLTERPGSSDTEEASSSLRANPYDGQSEENNLGNVSSWRNRKDMEQLSL